MEGEAIMDLQSPKAVALLRTFDGALEKLKAELQENLGRIDVLNATQVKHALELFSQRLIIAQHDFLEYLARTIGEPGGKVDAFDLQDVSSQRIPELAAAILAGGGGAFLVHLITFTSTTWLIHATTISLATIIGGAVGVSTGIATAGIGLAAGAVAGYAVAKGLRNRRAEANRSRITGNFDSMVMPALRQWAKKRIEAVWEE
jgi:hypothetical protein